MAIPELLAVGRVARAHGVRGRILLVPYNPGSDSLTRVTVLWLRAGAGEPARYEVARAERTTQGYLFALRGVEDRDAAAELRGREALVERSALPRPDEGEIYAADLIGFSVVDSSGTERGRVIDLESAGLQELLRVRGPARDSLVPLALVQEIDEASRRVVIEVPEGLFDLEE
ncbi:MAG TPA: ribosome maturation factor RimM [Myxococcales bacterium]|jgi:16S rRNA processing protein RimM|nr:ribosome maturation factor RimM [Myxococcales bacterium]